MQSSEQESKQAVKVLHFVWNLKFGGVEKVVYDITHQQLKEGLLPQLLVAQKIGQYLELYQELNIPIHEIKLRNGFSFPVYRLKHLFKLFKAFDIIHVHGFNPFVALALSLSKTKVIYTIHGGFGFGRKQKITDHWIRRLKIWFLNSRVDVITYNSQFTRMHAEKTLHTVRNRNTHLVYNGIPIEDIHKKLPKFETNSVDLSTKLNGQFVIGTSSRFAGFKRIDRLISAFAKIENKDNLVLLLVGDGPKLSAYKEQIESLEIQKHVIFTGYQKEVQAYQLLMDVCVFPSQNEPFGLVAVETLALGKPTLVFKNGGGLTEIIKEYKHEDIVKDEKELIERIQFYRNQKQTDKEEQKRKVISRRFDITKMTKHLLEIYLAILQKS